VSDESSPPDLRWLVERIDLNHRETTSSMAKLEVQLAASVAQLDRYVLWRVYEADQKARDIRDVAQDERTKRLEDADTSKTEGNRNWLRGLGQTLVGAALAVLAAWLTKGTH
jgi:hypothetical protein